MLSDEALWIRIVCEEILPGRKVAFILDLYHALECASDAVQAVTPDEGKRKKRMDWIREKLGTRQVAQVISKLKPHRRFGAFAACIRYCEANRDRMRCDLCRKRGLPVGSGIVESACKHIVENRFKESGCRWSKPAPTSCSPSDAASKTCAGPTSSIGGLAAKQPHDQKIWAAPVSLYAY